MIICNVCVFSDYSAEEELTELLGSCRPSDTVHMVGLLREILRTYVYTSTDCVTSGKFNIILTERREFSLFTKW